MPYQLLLLAILFKPSQHHNKIKCVILIIYKLSLFLIQKDTGGLRRVQIKYIHRDSQHIVHFQNVVFLYLQKKDVCGTFRAAELQRLILVQTTWVKMQNSIGSFIVMHFNGSHETPLRIFLIMHPRQYFYVVFQLRSPLLCQL